MERAPSPIKSWMQKHSPLKSRNKPLPIPPSDERHGDQNRRPIAQISGNARPIPAEQYDKPKRRISSLFKSTDKALPVAVAAAPTSTHHTSRGRHYTTSVPAHSSHRASFSPDLKNLSAKVNSLEEQLKEAREQLDSYASSSRRSRHGERPRSRGRAHRAKSSAPLHEPEQHNNVYLQNNQRFDGIVESLLLQQQQQHQQQRPRPSRGSTAQSNVVARRRSADMGDAFAHYKQTLDAYEEARDECAHAAAYASDGEIDGEAEDLSPGHLKRKRSQLRASSWQAVQDYAAREALSRQWDRHAGARPAAGPQQSTVRRVASESDRPPQRQKQFHDKSLPKSPPKSPSPTPRKRGEGHRRSGSKTKNELPPSEEAEAINEKRAAGESHSRPLSPSKRYASSPLKLLPVAEEFEWDDEIF